MPSLEIIYIGAHTTSNIMLTITFHFLFSIFLDWATEFHFPHFPHLGKASGKLTKSFLMNAKDAKRLTWEERKEMSDRNFVCFQRAPANDDSRKIDGDENSLHSSSPSSHRWNKKRWNVATTEDAPIFFIASVSTQKNCRGGLMA